MQPVLSQQPTSAAASAQQQPGTMMFSAKQAPFTLAAAVTMALQPIFLTLSKGPKGYFEYSVGSAALLCELSATNPHRLMTRLLTRSAAWFRAALAGAWTAATGSFTCVAGFAVGRMASYSPT